MNASVASEIIQELDASLDRLQALKARLVAAATACDAGTVPIKPAVVPKPSSGNGARSKGDWRVVEVAPNPSPETLESKVKRYLGLPPFHTAANLVRNSTPYLARLDKEHGSNAVNDMIRQLRRCSK